MNYQTAFGLTVQPRPANEQVLLLGKLAGIQAGDGWFQTSAVENLFKALHLPQPANISMSLSRLRKAQLVIFDQQERIWSLSPLGQQRADDLDSSMDPDQLVSRLADTPGVQYASERHTVLPPSFAPIRWHDALTRLLDRFPFETNVFLMTRFPARKPDPTDPIAPVICTIREICAKHHLTLHVASDRQADDELYGNVGAHMWACQYGIGILETHGIDRSGEPRTELNDNVLIELGSMLMTGRRCAILKDIRAPSPPSDLTTHIYKSVDLTDQNHVAEAISHWITDDLMLP